MRKSLRLVVLVPPVGPLLRIGEIGEKDARFLRRAGGNGNFTRRDFDADAAMFLRAVSILGVG